MWMQAYCTLSDQLQPVICKKWRGLLKKGVILQHDNDFHHSAHLSDSREKWRDGLRIVATSAIQSRISSKWFSFVCTTQGIVWRHYWTTIEKKVFNNTSGSFYMMPSKASMLRASADWQNDGNAVLNRRETMLKSNILVRIVWFTVTVLWLQSWNLLNDPRTLHQIICLKS